MRSFENFVDWDKPKAGKVSIIHTAMRIDTNIQYFDLFDIKNRYFMYSPEGELILNTEKRYSDDPDNVARKVDAWSDPYTIRGYIGGASSKYKNGIIHFSPPIYKDGYNEPRGGIKEATECIEMFIKRGGANDFIVIKGFTINSSFGAPNSYKDIEEGTWRDIKKNKITTRFDL